MLKKSDEKMIEEYFGNIREPLDPDRVAAVYERVQDRLAYNLRHDRASVNNDDYIILKALEARIPMDVKDLHCDEYFCSVCWAENMADEYRVGDKFCPECGQRLVKSEEY